jgi:hypothetical protein
MDTSSTNKQITAMCSFIAQVSLLFLCVLGLFFILTLIPLCRKLQNKSVKSTVMLKMNTATERWRKSEF